MFVKTPSFIPRFFPSLVWKKETTNKELWVTFDDGPDPKVTPWILDILKQEDVKATFFLVGEQVEKFPTLVTAIKEQGHIIANHSYHHLNGYLTSSKEYINDIERCQKLMPENKLFRPPFGKITHQQIKQLKNRYTIVLWDILSWDFKKTITSKRIKDNVVNNAEAGSVIVFHNNAKSYEKLAPILQETIVSLKEKGFCFSTTW